MKNTLIDLSREKKQLLMMCVDIFVVVFTLLASFSVRLGYWFIPNSDLVWLIVGTPFIAIIIFIRFGLYRTVLRYASFNVLWTIIQAVSLYALVWGIIGFLSGLDGIPRSVILINWIFLLLSIGGTRMFARWFLTRRLGLKNRYKIDDYSNNKVLIYGAGEAGIQLAQALKYSFEYMPVGFIDDLKELHGNYIGGLEVHPPNDIGDVINKLKVKEVFIAMPSTSRLAKEKIINALDSYSVIVRVLPSLSDLAGGKVSINDLRKVDIKDLLGRKAVSANKALLCENITGKMVMVTGAGGSIGSELSRQIAILKPKGLILYEVSELALYNIEKELNKFLNLEINIYPVLGDIKNANRLTKVFKSFKVDTVYHAAAYKHVPMVEFNNAEGVDNNIFGTLYCAEAAIDSGVETFVLISTDKAVRPTNTMGASKRCAELILQSLSKKQNVTKFTMVRFGNVLDSSGSVIPLFKQQIKDGGPITVTDKDIVRYFMTISEAVELVIQAGAMGKGGDVFVLDMNKPVRINDVAKKMIRLSGLEEKNEFNPNGDIEIKYIGLRPGEKLYEELVLGQNTSETDHPLIIRAIEDMLPWDELKPLLESLKIETQECNQEKIRKLLIHLVPEFKPQCGIVDILYQKEKSNVA